MSFTNKIKLKFTTKKSKLKKEKKKSYLQSTRIQNEVRELSLLFQGVKVKKKFNGGLDHAD